MEYYIAIKLCLLARIGTFSAKGQNSFILQSMSQLLNSAEIAVDSM